jgi:ClpP class serine protease
MQNEGLNMQAISNGKYKLMGAYWKALTPEETAIIQAQVDKIGVQFRAAMNAIRPCSDDAMGAGLCFDGEEAAERGLTDGILESMDEMLDELVE